MNMAEDIPGLVENTQICPHKQLEMCQGLLKKISSGLSLTNVETMSWTVVTGLAPLYLNLPQFETSFPKKDHKHVMWMLFVVMSLW